MITITICTLPASNNVHTWCCSLSFTAASFQFTTALFSWPDPSEYSQPYYFMHLQRYQQLVSKTLFSQLENASLIFRRSSPHGSDSRSGDNSLHVCHISGWLVYQSCFPLESLKGVNRIRELRLGLCALFLSSPWSWGVRPAMR